MASQTRRVGLDRLLANSARDNVSVKDLRDLYKNHGPTGLGGFIPLAEAAAKARVPLHEFVLSYTRANKLSILKSDLGPDGEEVISERQLNHILEGNAGGLEKALAYKGYEDGNEDAAAVRKILYGEGA